MTDCATRPDRFKTDDEWRQWKHDYQVAYNAANRERKKQVALGLTPKRYRTHVKKRRA
jgi:hypothetical protein